MDQVKVYLAVLKKHHFWLLCVLVLGMSSYAWWKLTGRYVEETAAKSSQIQQAFSGLQNIVSIETPPNDSFLEAVKAKNQALQADTRSAWQSLYERQLPFRPWPDNRLAAIAQIPREQEIPPGLLEVFQQLYHRQFDRLFTDVVKVMRTTVVDDVETTEGIVSWPEGSRSDLIKTYEWNQRPRSLQVRLAQEDFWVISALCHVIAQVNENAGATNPRNAVIKGILHMGVAQSAYQGDKLTFGLNPDFIVGMDKMPAEVNNQSDDTALVDGRYVDKNFLPLMGGQRSQIVQFQLIPVALRLKMDQRRLPELLAACINSPLPIEVQYVGFSDLLGHGQVSKPGAGGDGKSDMDLTPFDCTVEIRGSMYLYSMPPAETAAGQDEQVASTP